MLLSIIAVGLMRWQKAETWNLRPSFDLKAAKQVWSIFIDAESEGLAHHATFELTRLTKSISKKRTVETFGWDKLKIDDDESQEIPNWDAVVGSRGELLGIEGNIDDSYRRMLSGLTFIYPMKAVSLGDMWTFELKPARGEKITYLYQAKLKELVDGVKTIVVSAKVKESGKDATTGSGTWWLSKIGRVVKFEMKLDNWVVPMAGSDAVTNVVIRGKAR